MSTTTTTTKVSISKDRIKAAFAQAAEVTGPFNLKGKGHDNRVCLKPWVSSAAAQVTLRGQHFTTVCVGGKTAGPRRVFGYALVEKAAEILGVPVTELVTDNYR